MNFIKENFRGIVVLSIFIIPFFSLAQTTEPPATLPIKIDIKNPCTVNPCNDLKDVIVALLNNVVMPIAAVAVVIWIIWAGFSFLTAQGNPKKIQEAQQRLLWALIGAGILLGAAGIAALVENTVDSLTAPL